MRTSAPSSAAHLLTVIVIISMAENPLSEIDREVLVSLVQSRPYECTLNLLQSDAIVVGDGFHVFLRFMKDLCLLVEIALDGFLDLVRKSYGVMQ